MSHELHPLALEFVNTQINFKEIATDKDKQKPIGFVLLNLSTKSFGYIDVMQDYINLMNIGFDHYGRFHALVENICHLARRYSETDGKGNRKFQKEQVLLGLKYDEEYVPIQINGSVMRGDNLFLNPIYYAIRDGDPHFFNENKGKYQGGMGPFFIKLLRKIYETVDKNDHPDVLLDICRHLNEQVVPMLKVLTDLNEKQGANDFIQHLDLIALIEKLKQIKEIERQIENDDQMRADRRQQKTDLMATSKFNAASIMPQVRSLVEDKQDKQFLASRNRSQSVIGDNTISVEGGRRTRRHRGKSSGHKRSGHKRSGHKRSGHKRSGHKRSGHKRGGHKRSGHKRSGKRSSKSRRR